VQFEVIVHADNMAQAETMTNTLKNTAATTLTANMKASLQQANQDVPANLEASTSNAQYGVSSRSSNSFLEKPIDACFPGETVVAVQGRGKVKMAELRVGDHVLAVTQGGHLGFEPVLGFLHKFVGKAHAQHGAQHLSILHESGELRASPGHIVFTAEGSDKTVSGLKPGDLLIVSDDKGTLKTSAVLSSRPVGGSDAYAPLTASGTLVADGVVASNYASPTGAGGRFLTHAVAHAMLFPVRAFHASGGAALWELFGKTGSAEAELKGDAEELHPYLFIIYRCLRLDTVHALLSRLTM
jgi:hypothetical protein